jgi:hypothetical protein
MPCARATPSSPLFFFRFACSGAVGFTVPPAPKPLPAENAARTRGAAAHVHWQGEAVRAVEASQTASKSPHSPARFQLIKEMRTVEVMPSEQELQQVSPAAACSWVAMVALLHSRHSLTCLISQAQMQQAVEAHQQLLSRGAMAHAVGAEVGRMLDYLSKELVRCVAAASAPALGP